MEYRSPLFAKPDSDYIALRVQPRLASWMAAGHPDQVRLEGFLARAYELVQHQLEQAPDPLVLGLEVGLFESVPLLEAHDLDNYLFPLAKRLSERSGRPFASVWAASGMPRCHPSASRRPGR